MISIVKSLSQLQKVCQSYTPLLDAFVLTNQQMTIIYTVLKPESLPLSNPNHIQSLYGIPVFLESSPERAKAKALLLSSQGLKIALITDDNKQTLEFQT